MRSTEMQNPRSIGIDTLSTIEVLERINDEDKKVADAVEREMDSISMAVDIIYDAMCNGNRVFYIGAGTSGRLGVLDASECPPTYGVDKELFTGLIAGGDHALRFSVEGSEDDGHCAIEDLQEAGFKKGDVLVGLAASGRTPYVVAGLGYANEIGNDTISISCVKGSEMGRIAKVKIEVDTGPEIITGSTRMKAGTAQKLVLNMISTTVMVKMGKVYDGLMVDVKPANEKLVLRAISIISQITGCDDSRSRELLNLANMDVKTGILLGITSLEVGDIQKLLKENNGNISSIIRKTGGSHE